MSTAADPNASRPTPPLSATFERLGAAFARGAVLASRTRRASIAGLRLAQNALTGLDAFILTLGRDYRRVAADVVSFWEALGRAASHARSTAAASPRVAQLAAELARVAAAYRLAHIKAAFLPPQRAALALEAVHRREGHRVRAFCERQGGAILKLGQILSTRADLLPPAFVAELEGLQDRVPPPPLSEIEASLDSWLEPSWRDRFTLEAPVAAASLAAVYRGRLADGHPVAVKIQRPDASARIREDRAAMGLIAILVEQVLGSAPSADADGPASALDIDPRAVLDILAEVSDSLDGELDFVREAEHLQAFRDALTPAIAAVPAPVHPVHDKVLVMTFIEGRRLPDALAESRARSSQGPQGDETAAILTALAMTFAESLLIHGLVHGDPHPGNILVLDDGSGEGPARLALLDLGSAVVLTPELRRAYASLVFAWMGRQRRPLAAALAALGFFHRTNPDTTPAALEALADALCELPRPPDLASIDPRAEVERSISLMRAHADLALPGHLIRVGRALGTLGGTILSHREVLSADRLPLGPLLLQLLMRAAAAR